MHLTVSKADTFKNKLDRFWGNQNVKYCGVYTAELTGAGSSSEFYMK